MLLLTDGQFPWIRNGRETERSRVAPPPHGRRFGGP